MNRTPAVVKNVSPTELYDVMSGAASQDPARVQASSTRLKAMLDLPGAFDALHEIASQRTVPLPVRQQSIIQFKNAALSHWRSRKTFTDEQRVRIRAHCLTFIDEEDDLMAECNEVIVAKIARYDFPNNWSSLITDLINTINTNLQTRYSSENVEAAATLILRRALKLLHEIVKEFSSIKLLPGMKTMGQLVEQLHLILYDYYSKIASNFAATLNPSTIRLPRVSDDLLLAHLVYKCLVKMTTWLWNKSDRASKDELDKAQPWFHELFQTSAIQLKTLTDLRINLVLSVQAGPPDAIAHRSIDRLTRHVRLFGKFFRRLQQLATARFVALPMCTDLVLYYWSKVVQATDGSPDMIADSNHAVFPVRFLVQAMVLFKETLAQWTPTRKNGTPNENSLSREFVENAVQLLVTRFIPLNPSDLEGWMADPEEWVNLEEKDNELWEFELRPCSERVLMTLSLQYKQYVTPLLESTFKQIAAQPTPDLPSIIQKEALYCALGRCATRLKDVIPFQQWLEHTLAGEVRETNPNYPILKRRIAWLIGKWIGDMCAVASPLVWEVLVHLLQDQGPGTDTVVRLTAAVALRECVHAVHFNADVFAPFLPTVVRELIRLIGETDTFESKRRTTQTLNTVIEEAHTAIVPFVGMIAEPLPKLWTDAGDHWLFKSSLLLTVTKLIASIKEQSASLGGIVVPLVRESLSPGVSSYLDEDGLLLWLTALRNTITIQSVNGAPALFDLFPLALPLLATNLDLLGKIIDICEAYFLLDGTRILQSYAVDTFRAFVTALNNVTVTNNVKDMIMLINLLVQTTPPNLWGEAMHVSGLFAYVLKTLIDDNMGTPLLTECIYLLARIVMADRQIFLQLMSATASAQNTTETVLFEGLLDQWWAKFDHISEPRHRKLTAMGMASLVSTARPEVLQRLPTEIFNLWIDVFSEIKEAQVTIAAAQGASSPSSSPTSLRRYWEQDGPPSSYFQGTEDTPEYDRRKSVFDRDPVRTTQLSYFIAALLREAEAAYGSQAFQTVYLSKADPAVLKQVQDELVRSG